MICPKCNKKLELVSSGSEIEGQESCCNKCWNIIPFKVRKSRMAFIDREPEAFIFGLVACLLILTVLVAIAGWTYALVTGNPVP